MKKRYLLLLSWLMISGLRISAQLSATVNITNPTCVLTGSANVIASGGSNYSYKWSNGATTDTVTNLAAGTYTVTVYGTGAGIATWDSVYLETFDSTVETWSTNISTGANGNAFNYWDISDSCIGNGAIGTCVDNTYSPPVGANKCLYITAQPNSYGLPQYAGARYDAGGLCGFFSFCTNSNVAAQSPNISTAGVHNLVLSFQYTAGGAGLNDNASLLYSINGGTSFTTLDVSLKSNNSAGCNADGDAEGTWAYKSYVLPSSCNNISNLVIRFNWTDDGNADGNATDPSIAVDNVTLRDSIPGVGGLDSVVKSVTLSTPAPPAFSTSSLVVTSSKCGLNNGSVIGISVTGGRSPYQAEWKDSTGADISAYYNLNGVGGGVYNFVITDANGCSIDTNIRVGSISGPVIVTSGLQVQKAGCGQNNGAISGLGISGGQSPYNVEWKNSSNVVIGNNYGLSGVGAGTYTFVVTDGNSCTTDTSVVVGATGGPTILASDLVVKNATCGLANGAITGLTTSGGTSPVTVKWTNNNNAIVSQTDSATSLTRGVYTFTATDANGCSSDTAILVTSTPAATTPVISAPADSICISDSVNICCAPQNYSAYTWSNGNTTACFMGGPGTYNLSVIDSQGCEAVATTFILDTAAAVVPNITASGDTMYATTGGSSYQWYHTGQVISGATSEFYVTNTPGDYTVVIGANGCTYTSFSFTYRPLAVDNVSGGEMIKVYPNPLSSGNWQVVVDEKLIGANCVIFDAAGRTVFETELRNQNTAINADLPRGIYTIRIISEQKDFTLKLIKL